MCFSVAPVFVLLATVWVGSTVAVAPCCPDLIKKLKQHSDPNTECYPNGEVPSQKLMRTPVTFTLMPANLLPQDVDCVTGIQEETQALVTLHYEDGSTRLLTYKQTFTHDDYIQETDAEGLVYRIYVIRNSCNVYAYYRCLENGSGPGTGQDTVHIAIGCNNVDDKESLVVVEAAKRCFTQQLNITSSVDLHPCKCC